MSGAVTDSNRVCFMGLFIRFVTGCAWETAEHILGSIGHIKVSDTTLRSRRTEWVQAGVFDQLMEDCLAWYHEHVGVDMADVAIDGSTQLAPGGGPDTHNAPGSKGRKTMKWHIGVDSNGIGLGALIASGPANDLSCCNPPSTICARTGPPRSSVCPRQRLRLPVPATNSTTTRSHSRGHDAQPPGDGRLLSPG